MTYYTLEYIWIDSCNSLRSKTKVLYDSNIKKIVLNNIPLWNFDGSSTGQASGNNSDVNLIPRALFNNPFRDNSSLVLCDVYDSNLLPLQSNTRHKANEKFNSKLQEEPWFGLEQEYFIMRGLVPLGYTSNSSQGKYYCGVGQNNIFERKIVEKHLDYCLKAGIKISGINAEVAPGQWEFQVGPLLGINAGDHLWIARYILERLGEEDGLVIDFSPKPLKGEWNGSGCHTNFSTKNMREGTSDTSGIIFIREGIDKLSKKHKEHMEVYGENNRERMNGKYETSNYDVFTSGESNRGASTRLGFDTLKNNCGYFEDRRPSSNCDPYLVTSKIFETICLD